MKSVLVSILTSFNENLTYLTYTSIIEQIEHNFKYEIVIIVNSLYKEYYEKVVNKFIGLDVKIVETQSNGKPGMGHNSVINYFRENSIYDYLVPIDGDDFLYPYAFHQLEKLMCYNPDVVVGGNEDTISNFQKLYKETMVKLRYNYFLNIEPNILIRKKFELVSSGTPFRLILMGRNIFRENYVENYYCEKCSVFDDYMFYLNILQWNYTTDLNIYNINLKNIYIYYKANISSTCYQNSSNCEDNIELMVDKFYTLKELDKICSFKLNTLYISNYGGGNVVYKYYENNSIDYDSEDFMNSEQYKSNYDFCVDLSEKIYTETIKYVETEIEKIDIMDNSIKKKLYLLVENLILNGNYEHNIVKLLLTIGNKMNYIADDLNLCEKINILDLIGSDFRNEYILGNYIYTYMIINYIDYLGLYDIDIIESISMYYYYKNMVYKKLGKKNEKTIENGVLQLNNKKETIIFVDAMSIDYIPNTTYYRGLGGTQNSICYFACALSKYYNVLLLNKKTTKTVELCNNIYTLAYDTIENMMNMINNICPDIIVYNYIGYGTVLRKCVYKKCKLYMYEHICLYSNYEAKLKQDYINNYDKIIFVSEDQKHTYINKFGINGSKVEVINNGLSPICRYGGEKCIKNLWKKKKMQIIYFSSPQRGLECFIYIFPLLKQLYPELTLKIYSSLDIYNEKDIMGKLYEELGNIDGVEYIGSVDQETLMEEIESSLLFIYPVYVYETFCNCMVEAMSKGCYVIATNIGALKKIANNYGDFIDVKIDNVENHPYYGAITKEYVEKVVECAKNVIEMYKKKDEKLQLRLEEQIKYVYKKYDWDKNVYNKLFMG